MDNQNNNENNNFQNINQNNINQNNINIPNNINTNNPTPNINQNTIIQNNNENNNFQNINQNNINIPNNINTNNPTPNINQNTIISDNNINTNNNPNPTEPLNNNENLKKVEINYQPPSKFKTALLILFFIFLLAFIIFLPEITIFVNNYKNGSLNNTPKEIRTGKLICTYETTSDNMQVEYKRIFSFTDEKLETASYMMKIKNDITQDNTKIEDQKEKCLLLNKYTQNVDGIDVSCDYKNETLIENQKIDFKIASKESLDAAFAEIGGTYPEFTYKQDINKIRQNMVAGGYSCSKEN